MRNDRLRRTHRERLIVLFALLAATCTSPASATGEPSSDLSSFAGRFQHVGGDRQRRGLEAAIDRVVDRMNVFLRPIARPQIQRALRPEPRMAIQVVDPHRVRVELGEWRSPPMAIDGTPRTVAGPDGASTRYAVRLHQGWLYTRAETARGMRETWLTPMADGRAEGRRLDVRVRVTAERLPAPIEYALRFAESP